MDEIARRAAARNLRSFRKKERRGSSWRRRSKVEAATAGAAWQARGTANAGPFADDFDAKMQQRDEALQRATQWDAVQYLTKQHQDAQRKAKEEAEQAELERPLPPTRTGRGSWVSRTLNCRSPVARWPLLAWRQNLYNTYCTMPRVRP